MKNILIIFCFILSISTFGQGLKTSGKKIVDENQNEVLLKGVGLGGWMLQEPYMFNFSDGANTQHEFKQKLTDLVGASNTQLFYDDWLDNFVKEEDVDSIASWGFNSIRLPMHYNLFTLPIEDEPVEGENTWLTKGFEMVDNLLDWCESNQLYLILDLHAAPGGQGYEAAISDYDSTKPSLWESDFNKSKTIALWAQLADRYKDEPWIGGYDLLNETNWNLGTNELRNFYIQVTNAIRAVDPNHIIFIEGNWFANDFSGLTPPWDSNMVYSFHKYWTYNDTASIQWVLDMRNQQNVPLWLGESGENSNVWFRDAIKLFEDNDIGWAWWPWKKIESISCPFSINSNTDFESIVDYFSGQASAPSISQAMSGLNQLTQDLLIANTTYQKDVIDAMIRQPGSDTSIPFANHTIPGVIYLSDFDLGTNGLAYYDNVNADYHLNTNEFWAWNSGWVYRNDGVDISENTDTVNSNGYHIGYVQDQEWTNYTVEVQQAGFYHINFRYASPNPGGKVQLSMDDIDIAGIIDLSNSGGWNNFVSDISTNIYLDSGIQTLTVKVVGNVEFNMSSIEFILSTDPVPSIEVLSSTTLDDERSIKIVLNQPLNNQSINETMFDVKLNGESRAIDLVEIDPNNSRVIKLKLEDYLFYVDVITVSHVGNVLTSTYGMTLGAIQNYPVDNELPNRFLVSGKIEAEDYVNQFGLQTETTSDVGGGLNIGYTDAGDFAEYPIYINESGTYDVNLRVAAQSQLGTIELSLISDLSTESLGNYQIPVTGGWQSWVTSTGEADLLAGIYTLKMEVVQPGFNLNWLEFQFKEPLSINDIENKISITVYPNPITDTLNIVSNKHIIIKKIQIIDINGRLIKEAAEIKNNMHLRLNLSKIKSGMYFMIMYSDHGIFHKQLVKS